MSQPLKFGDLVETGEAGGLDVIAACDASPFTDVQEILEERKAAGISGSMQFTYRNPARSTQPERSLAGAGLLIVGACSYHRDPPPVPPAVGPVGRVARYVWADDQERLLAGLQAVADRLKSAGFKAVALSDQNHLVDRAVAYRAGLGWYGKNANLLIPGKGSFFILGAVLTNAGQSDIADLPEPNVVADGCGTCVRCIDACPTQAIVAPGVIDARRCLSWSLQTKGEFPLEHRVALGDRIYGCDDCQDVCPPNRLEIRRAAPSGSGSAVPQGDPEHAWVPIIELLALDDEAIMAKHGRWYVPSRDPDYIRRNALVVLGNTGNGDQPAVRRALNDALAHPRALVRAHAVWAARRLGCEDLVLNVASDPDPMVQVEMQRAVPLLASTSTPVTQRVP